MAKKLAPSKAPAKATAKPPTPPAPVVVVQAVAPIAAAAPQQPEIPVPTIQLQGAQQSTKQRLEQPDARRAQTVSVGASPGRLHYVTTRGVTRCFERVGVAANGDEVYRDQTRY